MSPAPNADTLMAALAYLRRGWSIVPLVPRTKQPAVKIAPYLSGAQRMSEEEARAYWSEHPEAGVAIVMGAPSGLIAIDVDPRNGGDLEQARRDCPTGLIARTGGGGLHLFVRPPGGHVAKGKTGRPGVDRQGDGSYVVAAPSVHPDTGARYEWLSEGEPGELPEWAVEKPVPASSGFKVKNEPGWAERELEAAATPIGAQDEMAIKLAGWLAQEGRSEHEAVTLLWDWARRLDQDQHDPWEYEEVADKVRRMMEKEAANPDPGAAGPLTDDSGAAVGGGGIEQLARAILALAGQRKTTERPAHSVEVRTVTLGDFFTTTDSAETWLCREFPIPDQSVFLVAGASHVGKSLLLLDLAVSVATGADFLGAYKIEGTGPVLFVIGEERRPTLRRRLNMFLDAKDWLKGYMEPELEALDDGTPALIYRSLRPRAARDIHLNFAGGFRLGDERAQDQLFARAAELKPRLIVFDSFKWISVARPRAT